MSENPLVTVIIPVYNQVAYLADAVESALGQTYGNKEIIIIDDASSDGSEKLAARLAQQDDISFYHNPIRLDCALTFNRGIGIASGQFYGILAADDSWEPDFIEKTLAALLEHKEAAFAYTRINIMDEKGHKTPRHQDRIFHQGSRFGEEFENIVRWLNPIPHHATLVRKQCIEQTGTYNPELVTTHDWDLWLRLSRNFKVVFIDEFLANYRVHPENISKSRSRQGDKEHYIPLLLDRLFDEPGLPASLKAREREIFARAYLDIAESFRVIKAFDKMKQFVVRALQSSCQPSIYLPYRKLVWECMKSLLLHREAKTVSGA